MEFKMSRFAVVASGLALCASSANAAFINELHYENQGADVGEFVEIVLNPGDVIGDFSVYLYNGSDGGQYGSTVSTFTQGATQNGFTVYSALVSGIQNGNPDGLALVSGGSAGTVVASGGVKQFLSYEGTFAATDGPANGLTSTDIGVRELDSSAYPAGGSLGLVGSGSNYSDFSFTTFGTDSRGAVNAGQTLVAVPEPLAAMGGLMLLGGVMLPRRKPVA